MKVCLSDQYGRQLLEDRGIADLATLEEFAKDFDTTYQWNMRSGVFVIDINFNTDEGYTQFLLMYGDYIK